jgi:selenocysteine lyase/cysteine desulfurase
VFQFDFQCFSFLVLHVQQHEHHSNLLPWRESGAEVVTIREEPVSGCVDLQHLAEQLDHYAGRFLIGSFCAASNLTGVMSEVDQITLLLHQKGALAFFDYAAAAPHVEIDMNPSRHLHSHLYSKDAIFISAHKFVGGVGSPGILVVKKKLLQNAVPAAPGGGTVFFVTENSHLYLQNLEERNEGGTPDIVGSIRAGLAFQLKHAVDVAWIKRKEIELSQKAWRSMSHNSNIVLFGPSPFVAERLPIFSFLIRFHDGNASQNRFLHYQYVCALLNDLFGIQTRGGCVCAGYTLFRFCNFFWYFSIHKFVDFSSVLTVNACWVSTNSCLNNSNPHCFKSTSWFVRDSHDSIWPTFNRTKKSISCSTPLISWPLTAGS